MDRRWQIQSACNMALTGAGLSLLNGEYCEVDRFDGKRCWVKRGTTGFSNAVFWSATKWVAQFGGSVRYETTEEANSPDGPYPINFTTATLGTDPAPQISVSSGWETVSTEGTPRWSEEEDLSVGCVEKRLKLGADISFVGEEYSRFLALLRDPDRRCEEIRIRRQWKCLGAWRTLWVGVFSVIGGDWDHDACTFVVRPEPDDEYKCIMRSLNRKENILQVMPVTAQAVVVPSLEFVVCRSGLPVNCTGVLDTDGFTPINEWVYAHNQSASACDPGPNATTYNMQILWREKVTTACVGGLPVPPAGSGWVLLTNNCGSNGTAVYVRPPTITWTFGDATVIETTDPVAVPPDTSCAWTYLGSLNIEDEIQPFCVGVWHHAYICLSAGDPVVFDRARTMQAAANYLLEKTGCPQTEMVSDFLEWNAPGTAEGYSPGINYVTGLGNQMNALVMIDKSDAADPGATNPATLGELTLAELFTMLMKGPRLFWRIENGKVRIEHWSHWNAEVGLSTVALPEAIRSEPLAHSSLKSEIPRIERGKAAEARDRDFVGADLRYSGPCVTVADEGEDVREQNVGPFTFDIAFVIDEPDQIDTSSGWVVLATAFNGSEYVAVMDHGALTGNFITNAPLSWANLQRDFWRHDRYLPTGTMNEQITEFEDFLPTIEQRNVVVRDCCLFLDFDSSKRVATRLGQLLGPVGNPLNAVVRRAEYDEGEESLTLTLRYSY